MISLAATTTSVPILLAAIVEAAPTPSGDLCGWIAECPPEEVCFITFPPMGRCIPRFAAAVAADEEEQK